MFLFCVFAFIIFGYYQTKASSSTMQSVPPYQTQDNGITSTSQQDNNVLSTEQHHEIDVLLTTTVTGQYGYYGLTMTSLNENYESTTTQQLENDASTSVLQNENDRQKTTNMEEDDALTTSVNENNAMTSTLHENDWSSTSTVIEPVNDGLSTTALHEDDFSSTTTLYEDDVSSTTEQETVSEISTIPSVLTSPSFDYNDVSTTQSYVVYTSTPLENWTLVTPIPVLTATDAYQLQIDLAVCDTTNDGFLINVTLEKTYQLTLVNMAQATTCRWDLFVPEGHVGAVQMTQPQFQGQDPPRNNPYMIIISTPKSGAREEAVWNNWEALSSTVHFECNKSGPVDDASSTVVLSVRVEKIKTLDVRPISNTSASSTLLITSPDFVIGEPRFFVQWVGSSHVVEVPANYVALVWISYFDLLTSQTNPADCSGFSKLNITTLPASETENATTTLLCGRQSLLDLMVFRSSINVTLVIQQNKKVPR
jgi:hypothetical protein